MLLEALLPEKVLRVLRVNTSSLTKREQPKLQTGEAGGQGWGPGWVEWGPGGAG